MDELRIKVEQLIEDLENETANRNMNDLEGGRYKTLFEVLDLIDEQMKWGGIVKEFRNTDEITKEDLEKMYNAIVKFDNYISSATRKPTDENIGLYEHWIDCRYDIENLIVSER